MEKRKRASQAFFKLSATIPTQQKMLQKAGKPDPSSGQSVFDDLRQMQQTCIDLTAIVGKIIQRKNLPDSLAAVFLPNIVSVTVTDERQGS